MMSKFYEPTEYEQMLIAAGWVTIESLDDDYREYAKNVGMDADSYSGWQSMRRELYQLSNAYDHEIEPYYQQHPKLPNTQVQQREKELISRMSELEVMLGY